MPRSYNPADYIRRIFAISPRVPAHVNIEISSACNLACKMCKRETYDFGNKFMPYETFCSIIDKLPSGVTSVSFGGYGEMLMHPRFNDMVRYAKSRGHWVETTTNGTFLKTREKIETLLQSGIDELRVSIDYFSDPLADPDIGHQYKPETLKALRTLCSVRNELGLKTYLGVNCVVNKGNVDQLELAVQSAQDAGADSIDFIRLDTCENKASRNVDLDYENNAYKQLLAKKWNIKIVTPLTRFSGLRSLYNLRQEMCFLRLQSAHIRVDGTVTPCSFGFATSNYGNIHETPLAKIWQSAPMQAVRRDDQNPTCKGCSIYK